MLPIAKWWRNKMNERGEERCVMLRKVEAEVRSLTRMEKDHLHIDGGLQHNNNMVSDLFL